MLDAATLPFIRARDVALPPSPRAVVVHDIERAFPDAQTNGVRLVLTQSTYLLQTWLDRLEAGDSLLATADEAAIERVAPEALKHRGPWREFELRRLDNSTRALTTEDSDIIEEKKFSVSCVLSTRSNQLLAAAYLESDPSERARLCRDAVAIERESAVALLALASACRETNDAAGARAALDRAIAIAPGFEAAHYESAKLWLAWDDLPRARDGFQRAADLMPGFSAAHINLGATLGELDDPAGALAAFERALAVDPDNHSLLNNIGVVSRERGELDRSEAALRRVIELAPTFVFGHYNLGHTLFLAGRNDEALRAYEEGHRLDPQTNRRQACRMAMVRLACGDTVGAERQLWDAANGAQPEERGDLLLEAFEIAHAWQQQHPNRASAESQAFLNRIGSEIIKSE
jgi:tetratricopeptide (TPR) repeat protein